jgi:hypothetical protein
MNQLKLCKISSQQRTEPKIPARVIKAYVRDRLRGFSERQQERERRRAEAQAQEAPRPAKSTLFDQENTPHEIETQPALCDAIGPQFFVCPNSGDRRPPAPVRDASRDSLCPLGTDRDRPGEQPPMKKNPDASIARTPNLECPACQVFRIHTPEEWKTFHPEAGHGNRADVRTERKDCPK